VSTAHILISFLAGIAGGFIGGVTGGAGILSIPVLIFLGLSTDAAIATNSMTGFGIVASALPRYARAGQVRWKTGFMLVPLTLLGGFLGATELVHINPSTLTVILGVLLLLLIPVVLLNPERGLKPVRTSRKVVITGCLVYFLTMLYSGFIGAGGAVFAIYVLVYFFGMTYIQAKSTISVSTIFLVIAELPVFLLHGLVDFRLGLPMTLGMYIGAGFGAKTALKKGNAWVRVFFVAVVAASSIKLLFFR
jgi:uncharacterized membrane protein YfcA